MGANVKFAFIAATIFTIFAGGSVLMSLVSTGTKAVNDEVSQLAASYSATFLNTTVFLVVLVVIVLILTGKRARF